MIPAGFIEQIVKVKVKYVSFQDYEVCPIKHDILKENNLDLKYIRISGYDGNDHIFCIRQCSSV